MVITLGLPKERASWFVIKALKITEKLVQSNLAIVVATEPVFLPVKYLKKLFSESLPAPK